MLLFNDKTLDEKNLESCPALFFFQESETMTELENIRSEVLSSNSKKSEVVTFHQ